MDKEQLIAFIENAFDEVEQPKDITIHVAEAHDDYDYEHDLAHREKDFFGPWQEVPLDHIESCRTALCYVDKVGMRFYLPAYMIWYLKYFGEDRIGDDNILYALDNNPNDQELFKYHQERFSLFNNSQLKACALFVKFCANDQTGFTDTYYAKKKYENYWHQFNVEIVT